MSDEFPEVILYSPEFSVTIKGATSVDHAIQEAERLFARFHPVDRRLGSSGFSADSSMRHVPEAQPGSMPYTPRDFPER